MRARLDETPAWRSRGDGRKCTRERERSAAFTKCYQHRVALRRPVATAAAATAATAEAKAALIRCYRHTAAANADADAEADADADAVPTTTTD